jgi:hypothetical protein
MTRGRNPDAFPLIATWIFSDLRSWFVVLQWRTAIWWSPVLFIILELILQVAGFGDL